MFFCTWIKLSFFIEREKVFIACLLVHGVPCVQLQRRLIWPDNVTII